MARNFEDFIKSVTDTMAGDADVKESGKREVITELDRLMDNPLELYLRWFRYGKLVYIDNPDLFDMFIDMLQEQGDIGLATSTLLRQRFISEYNGYTPSYFGKALSGGNDCVYILSYPCTMSGEDINFQYLDAEYGIASFVLNMNKPNMNNIIPVFYEWDKNGYIAKSIKYE